MVGRALYLYLIGFFLVCGPGIEALERPDIRFWEWRFVAGGATVGPGVFDRSGNYYFAAEDRFLYGLDRNGTMRWRVDLERRSSGSVAVGPDGTIFSVIENGSLLALNKDGNLIWRHRELGARLYAPLILDTGLVITASSRGDIVAVTHAGAEVWRLKTEDDITSDPVLGYDGNVYLTTAGGYVVGVSTQGRRLSRRYIGEVGTAIVPGDGITVGCEAGAVLRLDAMLEPMWRIDLGASVVTMVAGHGGTICALLEDGSLVHLEEGTATWRARPSPAAVTAMVAVANGVVVTLSNGALALILPDGSIAWEVKFDSAPIHPVLWENHLVVPTVEWVSYAFRVEGNLAPGWPLPRGGAQLTGVPADVFHGRTPPASYEENLDFIYLEEFLSSPFEQDQLNGLAEIAGRSRNLSGAYHYVLELCEEIAAAPFAGGGAGRTVSRRAREMAIGILGTIGDLRSVNVLVRLLQYEPYTDIQAALMRSLAALGSVRSGDVLDTALRLVTGNIATGPSDALALAAMDLVDAVFEYEGVLITGSAVELLSSVAAANYSRTTREKAVNMLRSLGVRR